MNTNKKEYTCCFCGGRFIGEGNDPSPLKEEGRCCDDCNIDVIIARIEEILDALEETDAQAAP